MMLNRTFLDLSAFPLSHSREPIFDWCVRYKRLEVRIGLPYHLNQREVEHVGARRIRIDEDAAAERVSRKPRAYQFAQPLEKRFARMEKDRMIVFFGLVQGEAVAALRWIEIESRPERVECIRPRLGE